MLIEAPASSLVVLIGPSGAGKSTFAARHFRATEVVSSDRCRALVADDESDQRATPAAFRVLAAIATERLVAGRRTVIDSTTVHPAARRPLLELARRHDCPAVAIVFDLPVEVCLQRNRFRSHRRVPAIVVRRQHDQLRRSLPGLGGEGFRHLHLLETVEAANVVQVSR